MGPLKTGFSAVNVKHIPSWLAVNVISGTGLDMSERQFPTTRTFDAAGIAEQHAIIFLAGMQRGYDDQVWNEVKHIWALEELKHKGRKWMNKIVFFVYYTIYHCCVRLAVGRVMYS